jgi:hypothetical protein
MSHFVIAFPPNFLFHARVVMECGSVQAIRRSFDGDYETRGPKARL